MSFTTLGINTALHHKLEALNYSTPTPIQRAAVPAILSQKDVLGIAPTGSGKTASYVLPILTQLLKENEASKSRNAHILVLVPTRELAVQVKEVFVLFAQGLLPSASIMAVFGGVAINPQMKNLYGVKVLIATPGRLLELLELKALSIAHITTLVLDEADKMLNMGFEDEMQRIIALLPKKRQNLLFSATLHEKVSQISSLVLHEPEVIKIEEEKENIDLIQQLAYYVPNEKKGVLLRYLLQNEAFNQVLIFTSSIYKADHVAEKLQKHKINARATHSKKSMQARTEALRDFKMGKLRVLVTTDLLSRGIDIAFLPCVINYELPRSPKDFIHRIGRTGRAENPGEAITFVSPEEEHHFKVIQKKMGKWVTRIDAQNLKL